MTHLIVDNEGDLEMGIKMAAHLAITSKDAMTLELSFPSVELMKIFSHNLFHTFVNSKVPQDNKLELIFNVPGETPDGAC
tara:strand:+ start:168 stop:407 length:240 start_codon:yes stop_codon:yes gene_type:complete